MDLIILLHRISFVLFYVIQLDLRPLPFFNRTQLSLVETGHTRQVAWFSMEVDFPEEWCFDPQ